MKNKVLRNRTLIAVFCILLAAAITFLISPMVNKLAAGTTEVLVLAQDVQRGSQIQASDLTVKQVSKNSLPAGAIQDASSVIGQYARASLFAGDFLTAQKLTQDANNAEHTFSSLDGKQVALSFTIDSFAAGLSGKLENGDVVTLIISDNSDHTFIPKNLQYVRVITTTTSEGVDQENVQENADGSYSLPATVTVLVTPEQAKLIASYADNATIQVALVCRADSQYAQEFLQKQEDILREVGHE